MKKVNYHDFILQESYPVICSDIFVYCDMSGSAFPCRGSLNVPNQTPRLWIMK
jgi:hypothetical protein